MAAVHDPSKLKITGIQIQIGSILYFAHMRFLSVRKALNRIADGPAPAG